MASGAIPCHFSWVMCLVFGSQLYLRPVDKWIRGWVTIFLIGNKVGIFSQALIQALKVICSFGAGTIVLFSQLTQIS